MFAANGVQNAAAVAGPTNFSGQIASYTLYKDSSSTATAEFLSDGAIQGYVGGSYGESAIANTLSGQTWYLPNQTGIGSSYWINATLITGSTPTSGVLNSWQSLASGASWELSIFGTSLLETSTLLVQISSSATGTPVVASGTVDLYARVDNLEPA